MPDITMCRGEFCPLKTNCYRYMAIPNEYRQYYFAKSPFTEAEQENGFVKCNHYWPLEFATGFKIKKEETD